MGTQNTIVSIQPGVAVRPAPPVKPDYKALFEQALTHLAAVYNTKDSFTDEVRKAHSRLLFKTSRPPTLRTPSVKALHDKAGQFLAEHSKV